MPLSKGDRKILLVAGVIFVVLMLIAALLATPQEAEGESRPTTWSTGSLGAKAAFLLLGEIGYRTERHTRSPLELSDPRNVTFIIAEPSLYANKEEMEAIERFIREGGRLITAGQSAAMMLPKKDVKATIAEDMDWEKFPALAPTDVTYNAPQITLAPQAYWTSNSSALALYGNEKRPVVVRYAYGEGTVFWWASATPLTNVGLKEPGNLEFFISCLGGKENLVLWDEYFHGYRHSEKAAKETRLLAGMLIQAGLLGLAVVWTFSRRSGPLRPSRPESRLSPLEFVETLGNLYHRVRASSVPVDVYYQRFMYWLTQRLGMSRNDSLEQIEQAMRSRWNFHDTEFTKILKECDAARYRADLPPGQALKLVRSLHLYAAQLKLFPGTVKENNRWKPFRNY